MDERFIQFSTGRSFPSIADCLGQGPPIRSPNSMLKINGNKINSHGMVTVSGERCDDTLGLIIVLTTLGTRAHCLQMSLLACLHHLACCHCSPFVHIELVVLVLAVRMEQVQDWIGAISKGVTITRHMAVSYFAPYTIYITAFSSTRPTIWQSVLNRSFLSVRVKNSLLTNYQLYIALNIPFIWLHCFGDLPLHKIFASDRLKYRHFIKIILKLKSKT